MRGTRYTTLARADWVMFLALNFPLLFFVPLQLLFSDYPGLFIPALFSSVAEAFLLAGLLIVVGILIERLRVALSSPTMVMALETCATIENALAEKRIKIPLEFIRSIEVIKGDLTLGAHVRGIIRPYLVISGGMVVGLKRGNSQAIAILLHELSHILHYDRLMPMFIGLAIVEGVGSIIKMAWTNWDAALEWTDLGMVIVFLALYKTFIFGMLISVLSKYREYYADARASLACPDKNAYLELLQAGIGRDVRHVSFFHPSLKKRISELQSAFPVIRHAWFWRLFLVAHLIVSWLQWMLFNIASDELPFEASYVYASIYAALACLGFMLVRGLLFRGQPQPVDDFSGLRSRSVSLKNNRYFVLIAGFVLVTFAVNNVSTANKSLWFSIGVAIVYFIFSSMKPKP